MPGATDGSRLSQFGGPVQVLLNPHVDTVPVQMPNTRQLEANRRAAAEAFTGADRHVLATEVARMSPYYCRMCGSCEGSCRQGLPVAHVLRYLMYADGYGNPERARQAFGALPPRLRRIHCAD